ncbi:MAG: condensation domain-containing protein, partial [Micromonosporaceae bacterium]
MTPAPGGNLSDAKRALLLRRLQQKRTEKANRERIVPTPRDGRLPCTYQQEGLWFLHQLDPASTVYHVPYAFRLRGELDPDALSQALADLVARHESLRSRFGSEQGVLYQVVDQAPAEWPLPVEELPDGAGEDAVRAWASEHGYRPFNLATGPLFVTRLLRLAPDEHLLMLVWHHIMMDGWSSGLLMNELATLYDAARAGVAAELPPLEVQPVDHAAWQRRRLTGENLERELTYWREKLDGLQPVNFPADRARPAQPTGAGAMFTMEVPSSVVAPVRDLARVEGVSFLAALQAAFLTVLSRYTGQTDLAVGSVFSGRTRSEIEPLLGFFVNPLVLRVSTDGNPTYRELVRRCSDTVLDATAHQDVPFSVVVDALRPERVPGRNPLFQISLTLQAAGTSGSLRLGEAEVEFSNLDARYSRFDLGLYVTERPDGALDLLVEYSTELYDEDRIRRLVEHLGMVLRAVGPDPDVRLDDVDVVSPAERTLMLRDWNPAPVSRGGPRLLHQVFAASAQHAPHAVAMRFRGEDLSYQDLDLRSSQLGHVLADEYGVGPGSVVG